jgi:serine/threonine protein phosphatase PrpC
MRLKVASATDPGLEREENEDSVMVWRNKAGLDTLLVVCDGMGGHAAGQMASSIAINTLTTVLAEDGGEGPDVDRLKRACKEANKAVFEAAQSNPEWMGMGSTMVVAAIRNGEVGVLNVGDSPAYLFRSGSAKLISQDHSWPAEQVRLGVIKPEEAATHPLKHRLTRAIGVWETIQSFTDKLKLEEGDAIVLCSDGVETAGVSVEEMGKLLLKDGDLDRGAKRVIDRCRELGAPDNVSVAVARIEVDVTKTQALPRLKKIGLMQKGAGH